MQKSKTKASNFLNGDFHIDLGFSLWFHHLSVVVCCSSSCAAFFDFPSSCSVHLIHIEDRLFNQIFERQRCRFRDMDIPVTLILSYIFVGIMPLYAINLDVVSLFADSSFMFLAVSNDVIFRFEWMNIILFLSKKILNEILSKKIKS